MWNGWVGGDMWNGWVGGEIWNDRLVEGWEMCRDGYWVGSLV